VPHHRCQLADAEPPSDAGAETAQIHTVEQAKYNSREETLAEASENEK